MNYHTATFPQFQKSVTRSYLPFANQEYFGRNTKAIGHRRYLHEQRVPFRLHCRSSAFLHKCRVYVKMQEYEQIR